MSILGVLLIVGLYISLLIIFFFIPSKKKKNKKKKKKEDLGGEQKDWMKTALSLEKYVNVLKDDIVSNEKEIKNRDKKLVVEQAKVKKLQEKLTQERSWQEKERNNQDKRLGQMNQLKQELEKVQELSNKEHTRNIKLERSGKDLERELAEMNTVRKDLDIENRKLKKDLDASKSECVRLKRENIVLSKIKEDASWVAQSEYKKLEKILKEKDKQLERKKRESSD